MSFVKSISLDAKAYKIWEERFGAYSQEFSKWVCDKLKEDNLQMMDIESKKEYIKEKKKELKKEKVILDIEETKVKNIEKREKAEEKDILKKQTQIEKEKEKAEKKEEERRYKKYMESQQKFYDMVKTKFPTKSEKWAEQLFQLWWKNHANKVGGITMEQICERYQHYNTGIWKG